MAENPAILRLFGLQLAKQNPDNKELTQQTFIPPSTEDGALQVTQAAYYGTYVDLDGTAKNEIELITRYREMSMQPEIESAIDDVINESIVQDDDGITLKLVLDDLEGVTDRVKKYIQDEYDTICKLLNYNNMAQEIFRRWYIDGRLFYHLIIDKENPKAGIQELRYVDPRKIRKIRELRKIKDANTGIDIITVANEYYIYTDKIQTSGGSAASSLPGIRIAKDSIVNINSGLMDSRRASVLSYLHKAIKPLNQLRMVEDATVIYRLSRAPERRIFKIDVGNLPKAKAEQFLNDMMTKYKNKLVYDAQTGQVRDDRRHLSMLEDFWLPMREGNRNSDITTLSGGENLGVMEDVIYFEKKLYKSLGVPIGRLSPQEGFSLGRPTEVTRDELKFSKFVERLRNRFSELFDQLLKIQCALKGICTPEEWDEFKEHIHFDFVKDNFFTELKEAEILQNRLSLLTTIDPFTSRYYSAKWIQKNVLRLNDDEIKEMQKEIDKENEEGGFGPVLQQPGMDGQQDPNGQQQPQQEPEPIDPQDKGLNDRFKNMKLNVS